MVDSDAYKRFFDNLNNHLYNHVDDTDRIEFNKQRGERLLKEYSEPLYERFIEQSEKWKGTTEGQQLTGLVEFFGSMKNSSVVRKGIENLILQLEARHKAKVN